MYRVSGVNGTTCICEVPSDVGLRGGSDYRVGHGYDLHEHDFGYVQLQSAHLQVQTLTPH